MAKRKKHTGKEKQYSLERENVERGIDIIMKNGFFHFMFIPYRMDFKKIRGSSIPYIVRSDGMLFINDKILLSPEQWANAIAHDILHHAFGHFDAEKMPGYEVTDEDGKVRKIVTCNDRVWNIACDAYINRFLSDMKMGESLYEFNFMSKIRDSADELEIYDYLMENGKWEDNNFIMDMQGIENPHYYSGTGSDYNRYANRFVAALSLEVSRAIYDVSEQKRAGYRNVAEEAAEWFVSCYPLLGSLAASFKIRYDSKLCIQEEIQIAAVDTDAGEIYVNPSAGLEPEELKFVLAHEYLHAGLQHRERCQGRNLYLWNVACDFVINAWLAEMKIGCMPEQGLLYDEKLNGMSAEEIYDLIVTDMRKINKMNTFRGYGMGDMIGNSKKTVYDGITNLDEFYKNALAQGLEYQQTSGRGLIPAGLIEEIRALAVPPVPWDVALAQWMQELFPLPEKRRSYARASRRQASTPDIPRAGFLKSDELGNGRTFGVIIDTSGSMSEKMLGLALGAVASYAVAREVSYVRVIFCDAHAYDAGYISSEEIGGKISVQGRGGTVLQPGIDKLEQAEDFPADGPILIITDGMIEENLQVHRKHAYLLPKGRNLPFKAQGSVFRFGET